MDASHKKLFEEHREEILRQALPRYGLTREQVYYLGGGTGDVYTCKLNNMSCILKVIHHSHRSTEDLYAEAYWVNYLADQGISVARFLPSLEGMLVETVPVDGSYFSIIVSEQAQGKTLERNDWQPAFFQQWGRSLGRIHALTKFYEPPHPCYKKPEWDESQEYWPQNLLPVSQALIIEKSRVVINHLSMLPKDHDSYGLIHHDIHPGNMRLTHDTITYFDFDDCRYSWFINDIAIVLFYALLEPGITEHQDIFARDFLRHFWNGYQSANRLDVIWLKQLPYFLKLRETELYAVLLFDGEDTWNAWCQEFMYNRRYRIEHDIPVSKIDFINLWE